MTNEVAPNLNEIGEQSFNRVIDSVFAEMTGTETAVAIERHTRDNGQQIYLIAALPGIPLESIHKAVFFTLREEGALGGCGCGECPWCVQVNEEVH